MKLKRTIPSGFPTQSPTITAIAIDSVKATDFDRYTSVCNGDERHNDETDPRMKDEG